MLFGGKLEPCGLASWKIRAVWVGEWGAHICSYMCELARGAQEYRRAVVKLLHEIIALDPAKTGVAGSKVQLRPTSPLVLKVYASDYDASA